MRGWEGVGQAAAVKGAVREKGVVARRVEEAKVGEMRVEEGKLGETRVAGGKEAVRRVVVGKVTQAAEEMEDEEGVGREALEGKVAEKMKRGGVLEILGEVAERLHRHRWCNSVIRNPT